MSTLAGFRRRSLGAISAAASALVLLPAAAAIPSRTSGVAPLYVFFDATGTTSTATTQPFHDVDYRWTFGETTGPGIGTWSTGSRAGMRSRNAAYGPCAGHVFETPGTYTITVSAWYAGVAVTRDITITVADPEVVFAGANTICFSNSTDFTGAPSGCVQVASTSDFDAAINTYIAAGKRLLFRAGHTFSNSTNPFADAAGPWTIGKFGAGAKPIVQAGTSHGIVLSRTTQSAVCSDGRIMDLSIDNQGSTSAYGLTTNGALSSFTMLRLDIANGHGGIALNDSTLDVVNASVPLTYPLFDNCVIQDCTIDNIGGGSGGLGLYVSGSRLSVMGNTISRCTAAEHCIRCPVLVKSVISGNDVSGAAANKFDITIRALPFSGTVTMPAGSYTEYVVVSENKVHKGVGAGLNSIAVAYGVGNQADDSRVRNVISERNWISAGAATQYLIDITAHSFVTVRNELLDTSGGTEHTCVQVHRNGAAPSPSPANIKMANCSAYSSNSGDFTFANVAAETSAVEVKNNLCYAPSSTTPVGILNAGQSNASVTAANNTSDAQIKSTDPLFSGALTSVDGWKITSASSYTRNAGADVPVWSDFFGVVRVAGSMDIGASEQA